MADKVTNITELPLDILVLVLPYLDAKSFLAFCSTCKAFQQPSIRLDPAYWSHATRSTFRVPNQPVVQHDGPRWQNMYRRMLHQSRVFTWGSNQHQRLGHSYAARIPRNPMIPPGFRRHRFPQKEHCSIPTEMERVQELGVIADLQCGGWSTTILDSEGSLHTVGVLDGMIAIHNANAEPGPQRLTFPAGHTASRSDRYEPTTAVREFSSGRAHILALTDSGRIWSWYHTQRSGLHVKFWSADVKEDSSNKPFSASTSLYGRVKQVVAGWSCSSAYIYGTGIVIWDPVTRTRGNNSNEEEDTIITEHVEVPKTAYQRIKGASRETEDDKALGEDVGVVLNYIMLENFVVFVTDIGKVFCGRLAAQNRVEDILELQGLRNDSGKLSDVQGSFRRFAVFKNGEVIIAHQDYLQACWDARHTNHEQIGIQGLEKIPALQNNDVISVAFGDYHFLALHSSGRITSYGTEMQGCGALGLGDAPESRLRGVRSGGFNRDASLLPHAYTHGRQVWFDEEKEEWIKFMTEGGKDPEEAKERLSLFRSHTTVQGEVSEWFEQEGKYWDETASTPASLDEEDGLSPHFGLRVSAAGWHSGALLLVNDKPKTQYNWKERSFPRLKLSDGTEMPGSVPFDQWRYGRPEWQLDVRV
ncbi:RCC1/BLIP-II [Corynespora cassiicola Philippines]|uniref:RCC1/BLIP-II n=1 Tax=Corynespora cassiicola Philippines TaxID=1448308 RepID=A0A2T2NKG9_CORCC|nr:RCC1/BLIP-II [Corynespora cassiicola Philippines]